MKIKDLYSDESKWTKGAYAKTSEGYFTYSRDGGAVCWCLAGAALKVSCGTQEAFSAIWNKVFAEVGMDMVTWNDDPERTFEEVKALVEKLDI